MSTSEFEKVVKFSLRVLRGIGIYTAFIAGMLTVLILCTLVPPMQGYVHEFVLSLADRMVPSSVAAAAWVQAIGSITAILAAIWISGSERKIQEDKEKQRNRISTYRATQTLERALSVYIEVDDIRNVPINGSLGVMALAEMVRPSEFMVDALRDAEGLATLYDKDIALPLIELAADVKQLKKMADSYPRIIGEDKGEQFLNSIDEVRGPMLRKCKDLRKRILPLVEAKRRADIEKRILEEDAHTW